MENNRTLWLTPECVLVYPSLFEPTSFEKEEPTYSGTFLISKNADMNPAKEAIYEAFASKFGRNSKMTGTRYPIRDGNEKAVDENGGIDKENFYYDRWFFRAKSKWQPAIVNIYNDPIADENELYGGCIVRAYISFYGYNYMGNKGVGCGLRAVCKIEDGEPLGSGRINTAEVFGNVLQEKERFEDSMPDFNSQEYNETGQQNHEPFQEPSTHGPENDDCPF